ncbi:MAG: F0F1 ATP synthase subunit epsilon [Desulfobacterales bacterium]|nr:F0F1 ATP synthase subunit epsilon [Desulfobacterales bacterium]
MEKLKLEVVTPAKVVVSADVDAVVAPGSEGEFGVLPGHVLFLSGIVPGELRYTSGTEKTSLAVTVGFAEVSNNRVSILVDAAERVSDIDVDRAKMAMEKAKERLAKDRASKDIDFKRAEAALNRAMARIRVSEKTK